MSYERKPKRPRGAGVPGISGVNVGADYTDEEREFLVAVERYKRVQRRPWPTWREVLGVLRGLGYHR